MADKISNAVGHYFKRWLCFLNLYVFAWYEEKNYIYVNLQKRKYKCFISLQNITLLFHLLARISLFTSHLPRRGQISKLHKRFLYKYHNWSLLSARCFSWGLYSINFPLQKHVFLKHSLTYRCFASFHSQHLLVDCVYLVCWAGDHIHGVQVKKTHPLQPVQTWSVVSVRTIRVGTILSTVW